MRYQYCCCLQYYLYTQFFHSTMLVVVITKAVFLLYGLSLSGYQGLRKIGGLGRYFKGVIIITTTGLYLCYCQYGLLQLCQGYEFRSNSKICLRFEQRIQNFPSYIKINQILIKIITYKIIFTLIIAIIMGWSICQGYLLFNK